MLKSFWVACDFVYETLKVGTLEYTLGQSSNEEGGQ